MSLIHELRNVAINNEHLFPSALLVISNFPFSMEKNQKFSRDENKTIV